MGAPKIPDLWVPIARTNAVWAFDLAFPEEDWTGDAVSVVFVRQGLPAESFEASVGDGVLAPTEDLAVGLRVPVEIWEDKTPGRWSVEVRRTGGGQPTVDAVFDLRLQRGLSQAHENGESGEPTVGDGSAAPGRVLVTRSGRVEVVRAGGVQGPPGPASAALSRTADGAISGHRVVIDLGAGVAGYPDLDDRDHGELLIGVTTNAAADGGTLTIMGEGSIVEPSWSWTPGLPIFCGAAGVLTQTAPTAGAWLRQVGVAVAANEMTVGLRPPFYPAL